MIIGGGTNYLLDVLCLKKATLEEHNEYWKNRLQDRLVKLGYSLSNPVGKLTRAQKDVLVDILKDKPVNFNYNPELFYELLKCEIYST